MKCEERKKRKLIKQKHFLFNKMSFFLMVDRAIINNIVNKKKIEHQLRKRVNVFCFHISSELISINTMYFKTFLEI